MASPSNLALVLSSIARNQDHLDGTDQPVPTKRKGSIRLTEVKRMARARGSSQLQLAVSDVQRMSLVEPDHSKVININVAIPPDLFQSPHTVINLNVCPANNNDSNGNHLGSTSLASRSARLTLSSDQAPINGEAGVIPSTGRLTNSDSPTPSSSNGAPSTTDAVWSYTFDPIPMPLKAAQRRAKERKGKEKVHA